MVKRRTMPKYVERTTVGSCPYCSKHVEAVEAHVKAKHRNEPFTKKEMKR
jgi:hypothetical protein